mgnify:CR=1 FL=1
MQMGSKKRAAWSKAKSEFLSTATGGDMSDLFAREDERRDALDAERDEAWRYKSCERKNRYDTRAEADKLWGKLRGLRINEDENGKTNLALADVDGEVLVVSQFTLFADCRHGRRPSFTDAGAPDVANELYEYFLTLVREDVEHVAHGIFGADMKVDLVNDGPFTIVLDTDAL